MKIRIHPLQEKSPQISPGRPERDWMDAFLSKQPYRCLPLVIANTSGWELLTPTPFRATWNGGADQHDLVLESPFGVHPNAHTNFASSHFGGGVLTFHTGYLFRTPKDWDMWVGGPPNSLKHGIQALTGIVETTWLPQSFTMNWRFTAPGTVTFSAGEPFCFIMPVPHAAIDAFEPVIEPLSADPEMEEQTRAWQKSRTDFIEATKFRTADDSSQAWQRHYFQGLNIDGSKGPGDHIHKRRLKTPRMAGESEGE